MIQQSAAVIRFIRAGLKGGEKGFYIAPESTATKVLDAMSARGTNVNTAIETGSLTVATPKETYLESQDFDPDRMVVSWRNPSELPGPPGTQPFDSAMCL